MIIEYGPNKTPITVFKPGHIYKLKDPTLTGIYLGHVNNHGNFLVSLRDGQTWNSQSTFGVAGPEAFIDVTHEFKVTNIR